MKKLLAALAIVSLAAVTQADVILGFDMQGDAGSAQYNSADTVIANIETATPTYNTLARTGVNSTAAANSYNSLNWNITSDFNQNNQYIAFTLSPLSGYVLTLTDIQYAINGSPTGPVNGRWGYSVGGGSFTFQTDWTILNAAPSALSTWDFDDIVTTASVEFRFWAWGTQSIGGTTAAGSGGTVRIGNIAGNDLVLNGTVDVIPEPTTIGLVLLGLTGVRLFMRRRVA